MTCMFIAEWFINMHVQHKKWYNASEEVVHINVWSFIYVVCTTRHLSVMSHVYTSPYLGCTMAALHCRSHCTALMSALQGAQINSAGACSNTSMPGSGRFAFSVLVDINSVH